jgi:hypothetical protein
MEIRDFLSTTRFTEQENKGSIFLSKRKHTIDLSIHKTNYMNMTKKTQIRKIYVNPSEEFPDDSGIAGASMAGGATGPGLARPTFEGDGYLGEHEACDYQVQNNRETSWLEEALPLICAREGDGFL